MKTSILKKAGFPLIIWLTFISSSFANDVTILGGFYDQAQYTGTSTKGNYKIEITKDNYSFQPGQFSINITLPLQGSYDPARAAEAIIPAGWQLTVTTKNSLILTMSAAYSGTSSPENRRRNFSIPVITSAIATDQPTLVTVDWADPTVEEATFGNSAGSVLNIIATPLPVELVSFVVHKENDRTNLTWVTTKEINSDRFEVQHSLEGKNWNNIGVVIAAGSGIISNEYIFTHANPLNGENLYRLKMIDKDGSFAYSRIVEVNFDIVSNFYLYPNPAVNTINVRMDKISDNDQISKIVIYDLDGRIVFSANNLLSNEIDVKKLASGKYVVAITRKDGITRIKNVMVTK